MPASARDALYLASHGAGIALGPITSADGKTESQGLSLSPAVSSSVSQHFQLRAMPSFLSSNMFKVTKDGIEVGVEVIEDPSEVMEILNHSLQPAALKKLQKRIKRSEEIFLEWSGGQKDKQPMVWHFLVHLVRNGVPKGRTSIHVFEVHQDHLEVAQQMAKMVKSRLKKDNDWTETNHISMKPEEFFRPLV